MYVMSVHPLIFGDVIEQEVTRVQKIFPVIIGMYAHECTALNFSLCHDSLNIIAILKSNNSNTNLMNNINRK